ncbi:predicted protein [Uncinocarpus reesii 1704]|uniref:YDG domain-containing protein n=1 Tax=Uncinocarpus reesii (strain UAMH 1704) TaxID=336963 RepID=C4JVN5_UNCRE|nr:uncharacterized protein UREG_06627 [Uncinocarpus reesii 1704]EEP81762.1 predicted protein [Uncinocarpus reesii 1704]
MDKVISISESDSHDSPFMEMEESPPSPSPAPKRVQDDGDEQHAAKRPKVSVSSPIKCTCAISSNCVLAAQNGVRDCRTTSTPAPRRQKPKTPIINFPTALSTKQQAKFKRTLDEMTEILSLYIRSIDTPSSDLPNIFNQMRHRVQQLPFSEAHPSCQEGLRSRFLNPESGFPAIIRDHSIPWDIRLDVDVLRMRWEKGDLDISLDRGLITTVTRTVSRKFDTAFPFKVPCNQIGEGTLRNGQWFSWQICAVRDGAHGEIEAGVSSHGEIAISIVLGSGRGYADSDQGETIYYSGTHGKTGVISAGTKALRDSFTKRSPIRVLRSSRLPAINPYRPAQGLRYDGLYEIVDEEMMDEEKQLYRFKLERIEGQTPIRYQGPEKRPNPKELEEYDRLRKFMTASRPKKPSP